MPQQPVNLVINLTSEGSFVMGISARTVPRAGRSSHEGVSPLGVLRASDRIVDSSKIPQRGNRKPPPAGKPKV